MTKKVTISDVAKEAGVSTFTVSRALRDLDYVAADTKQRVLKAAKKLDFKPSKSAAALASGQTGRVALLIGEKISGWFNGELQEGVYDVLRPANYDMIVYRAGSQEERQKFFEDLPAKRNADSLIVASFSTKEEKDALTAMGMPIVSVNSPDTEYCQGSVRIDDRKAEYSAVRYMAALGHKKVCFIDRDNPLPTYHWGTDSRSIGYNDAIKDLNLIDCGILQMHADHEDSAKQVAAQVISLPQRPTALCVWSDQCAVGLSYQLQKLGIRIPQDISIIGFDGSPIAKATGMTTVVQQPREIGKIAAQKTLALMSGKQLVDKDTIIDTVIDPADSTLSISADSLHS